MARIDTLRIPEELASRIERLAAEMSEPPAELAEECLKRGIDEIELARRQLAEIRRLRERLPAIEVSESELEAFVNEGRP